MLPFLSPRSPNSMLSLCHGILPNVVSVLFTTLNWGGGGTNVVLSMFNNFVILAGMGFVEGFVQDCSYIWKLAIATGHAMHICNDLHYYYLFII
jgi:hypothetical protein